MIYIFILSFCFFAFYDYIYAYNYLDSKIFFSKNGSKLVKYIKENNSKYNLINKIKKEIKINVLIKTNFKQVFVLIFMFVSFFCLNIFIFKKILFSNFIVLDLGYKKIDIVSSFGIYNIIFKYLYYVIYALFLGIVIFKNKNSFNVFLRNINIKSKKKQKNILIEVENDKTEKIIISKNEEGLEVSIPILGLYQNILITGSIGSGKTSSAVANIVDELIKKEYSGLILDVKGNFIETVEKICKKYNKKEKLYILSDKNNFKYNPLGTLIKPIEMASRLRQVIEIISPINNSDSYWLDKVENVFFNLIILINYYNDRKIDFMEIHKLISGSEYLKIKIKECKIKILKSNIDDKTAFEMNSVFSFFEKEYFLLEARIKNIISSEITRITIPFVTDYETYKRFGSYCEANYILKLKNDGIFVFSMNIANNKVLSRILSTFIKLEFQKQVISTIGNNKTSFLIADEYQEFANTEDAQFLSLSREAKCINVLSMQSYTSLKKSLKDDNSAQIIIQNMVNKIWFRNDDNYTVGEIVKQIGKESITKESITISEGAQETKKNVLMNGFKNKKSNISETINYSETRENIYDSNYFTKYLKTFEAVAFLSDGMCIKSIKKINFERWDLKNEKEG